MSVLKYFKNIPRSPYGGRQGSNVIFFFFKFATKSLEKKKRGACRPPNGRQGTVGPVARGVGDRPLFFPGTYFELFERVFVIIIGKISAANSYRT